MPVQWEGVFPALTTKFTPDDKLDAEAMELHFCRQIDAGVNGFVVLGSLGENGTLSPDEKQEIIKLATRVSNNRIPILSGVAETTTSRACHFAEQAAANGAHGFMVLPPMQYVSDKRETIHYLRTIAQATDRPIMIYNNPIAYQVDVTPAMFAELADEPRFVALKESSEDVRRITDIRNLVGNRYKIFVGVDDLALESLLLGADGWVAGLVCAFPEETVALYKLVKAGRIPEALAMYRWFTPLLHLDAQVKFIQYIKLAEAMAGLGTERMRSPRLPITGQERKEVESIIRRALDTRPTLPKA
jgi:4-hydroxy-tetrahydrodipicolinate synthase